MNKTRHSFDADVQLSGAKALEDISDANAGPATVRRSRTRRLTVTTAILITLAVTLAGVLIWVNFSVGEKKVQREVAHLYSVADPQFFRSMGLMLGPPILEGNKVVDLVNGDQIFPAMLDAIKSARKTILFETYIYWSGDIGRRFADALSERARAGVKVHVLADWVGSVKMDAELVAQMERAGVEFQRFHPLRWYNLGRVNNRTHRKLLIVDGRIGFTGGVGIADAWLGNAEDPEHWRDSHFRVEGPVVAQMQGVMLDNWIKTTGKVLHGTDYFPPLSPAGDQRAQVFSSSPNGGSESMLMMYLLSIASASKSIDIAASYFVPDDLTRKALIDAVRRGVRVRVITPGEHIDTEVVRRASRGLWGDLLEAGIEIHEYQPTMYHTKVMIVDGLLVSVGSTNFDERSFRLNDEANLNVYEEGFARRQTDVFEADLKNSRRITFEAWQKRPPLEKLWEHTLALIGPLL